MRWSPILLALAACAGASRSHGVAIAIDRDATSPGIPRVAFRDGEGAWREVVPAGDSVTVAPTQPRYAIATFCEHATARTVTIWYRTKDDPATIEIGGCRPFTEVEVSGEVRGLGDDAATIVIGSDSEDVGPDGRYVILTEDWVRDIVVLRKAIQYTQEVNAVVIERDVDLSEGGTHDIDVNGRGFELTTEEVEIIGASAAESIAVAATLETANGTQAGLSYVIAPPYTAAALPRGALAPGDRWTVRVSTTSPDGAKRLATGPGMTITLPPQMREVQVTPTRDGEIAVDWQAVTSSSEYFLLLFQRAVDGSMLFAGAHITPSWLDGVELLTYTTESVDLPGWEGGQLGDTTTEWTLFANTGGPNEDGAPTSASYRTGRVRP